MTLHAHDISCKLFDALAEGGGGPEAISALSAAEYTRHLLLLRGVVEEAERAGADQARFSRDGYALLAMVQRADPLAAREVIRYPAVGAWLLRTLHGLLGETPTAGPGPAGLGALAAAAAIRAKFPAEVEVRPVAGTVVSLARHRRGRRSGRNCAYLSWSSRDLHAAQCRPGS